MNASNRSQNRTAGILLPVFSLPSPYGIGSLGQAAYDWILFLEAAGQAYWQVLPLGPTIFGDSPYQSPSAFAGSPYYIDLDLLRLDGLLTDAECTRARPPLDAPPHQVDYFWLFQTRPALLQAAYARFTDEAALSDFYTRNRSWLEDYALYEAIKEKLGRTAWIEWEDGIRLRKPEALAHYRQTLQAEIRYHIFLQYLFFKQWAQLKAFAHAHGIQLIGDIPIYVALDSADVWARSDLFLLDENKLPLEVAGVPPDAFAKTGQLWGNPLYDWEKMKQADGYGWWYERLQACLCMYDVVRIDHFRGFESYYAIPAAHRTAELGTWRKGPGADFVSFLHTRLPDASIIAEDLGFLTPAVRALLQKSGYPGMKVLQFAFDTRDDNGADAYFPYRYEYNSVAYTGTHDNDTTAGWFENARPADIALAMEYLGVANAKEGCRALVRAALASPSRLCVIPIQDYLCLGSEARINTPSTLGGRNWKWRLTPGQCGPALAQLMARMAQLYGRFS